MINLSISLNIDENILANIFTKLENSDTIENYILELISKDLSSKVFLEENFYFDQSKEKIYHNEERIVFTKIEYDLFKFLFDNRDRVISAEELLNVFWDANKAAKFSLRNHIKQLRDKLYPSLIKSYHKRGYRMIINESIKGNVK